MFHALKHAVGLLLLGSLFYATGYLIEAIGRRFEIPALGPFLVRVALGTIAWIYLLFGLACIGWFRAEVALPLAGVAIAAAVARAALSTGVPLSTMRRLRANWSVAHFATGCLVCAAPGLILVAFFFRNLSPHIGWDDNVYHLTLPKLYLAHGGFRSVPFNVYSNWPHNVELLYGLAMMLGDHVLAKLVHTLFLALVLVAVFRICRQHTSRSTAILATLLVLGNQVLVFEASRAYVDIAFAFFFLIAVICAADHLRSGRNASLLMSGTCCGALAGTKLSGLAGFACVLALIVFARPSWDPKRLVRIGMWLGLPTALLALPWYVKTYLYTGNPIYPFWFRVLGGIEWNATLARQFLDWQHSIGMGRSFYDYLALPARVVLQGAPGYAHFDGQIGTFWIIAVPLSILVSCRANAVRPYLLCAAGYFLLWAFSSQQMRFLIAVLPLLAVATALAVGWIADSLASPVRTGLNAALLAGTCAVVTPALYPVCERAWATATKLVRQGPSGRRSVIPEGYAFINHSTPRTSKLMLLNVNHGFFLDREYIADSFFEASQMNSILSQAKTQAELSAVLSNLAVTHVYVRRVDRGIPYPGLLWSFLRNDHRARLAYSCSQGRCSLYELRRD